MNNMLARQGTSCQMLWARLLLLWRVDADETYQVVHLKKGEADTRYTAIRTVEGRGRLTVTDGQEYSLKAGTIAFFSLNSIDCYGAEAENWKFFWFEFDIEELLRKNLNKVSEIPVLPQENEDMERCFACLGSRRSSECMLAEALFNHLLSSWQERAASGKSEDLSIQQIMALLEKGSRERISVEEMAKESGMCIRTFRDAVRRTTGLSPKAYMTKIDMTAALELLQTTNLTVAEVSNRLNYDNPFYFSRVFKKYYGIAPQYIRTFILEK